MAKKVSPIPQGYHSVTPYLIIKGAANAIEFYKKALSATEIFRMPTPDGKIAHAEIKIGDSPIMLADEHPQMNAHSPQTIGGSPVMMHVYVNDVEQLYNQAVAAGATVLRPLANQFYGDRSGSLKDPYGHVWCLATHIEDLSAEEISERAKANMNC